MNTKFYLSFFLCFSFISFAVAQTAPIVQNTGTYTFWNTDMQTFAAEGSTESWIQLKSNFQTNDNHFFNQQKIAFGLTNNDNIDFYKLIKVDANYEVKQFKHFYNGIEVEHSRINAHVINDAFVRINTKLNRISNLTTQASISESTALNTALTEISASKYTWQDSIYLSKNNLAYHDEYPNGKLIIGNYNGANKLCWKFEINTLDSLHQSLTLYINAQDNTVEFVKTRTHSCITHSSTDIITSSAIPAGTTLNVEIDANDYLNHQKNCAGILEDVHETISYNDFTNTYTQILKTNSNHNFITAHWTSQKALEYYQNVFGRNSFDDNGAAFKTRLITNSNPHIFPNWTRLNNGLAYINVNQDGSRATLDIMGHEFTHGVIQETSDLEYYLESGAINESFADIFGEMTEYYTESLASGNTLTPDYLMGEDMQLLNASDPLYFRNLANPQNDNMPDTYLSDDWVDVTNCIPRQMSDYCGIHTNSSVMNYWFYLIAEGGSGTNNPINNSTQFTYNIPTGGIGRQNAQKIAYRTMISLLPTNNFRETAFNSLWHTMQIFGHCSSEFNIVFEAWQAVGVLFDTDKILFNPPIDIVGITTCPTNSLGEITIPLSLFPPSTCILSLNGSVINNDIVSTNEKTYSNLLPGYYNIDVTDANGCNSSQNFVLDVNDMIIDVAVHNPCNTAPLSTNIGAMVTSISGGHPPYNILWTAPNPASIFFNPISSSQYQLNIGVYTITVTDANNCTYFEQIDLTAADRKFDFTINNTTSYTNSNGPITIQLDCVGQNTAIDITNITGASPVHTYFKWSEASLGTILDGGAPINYNFLALGAGMFSYLLADANDCSGYLSINILDPAPLVINETITHPSCLGDGSIMLSFTGSSSAAPTFEWSDGVNIIATTQNVTGLSEGTYTVTVTDVCTNTNETISFTLNNTTIFPSGTNQINGVIITGSLTWNSPKHITDDIVINNGATLNISGYGTTIYFDAGVGIIVEDGGVLNIHDGPILKSSCDNDLWLGIENAGATTISKSKIIDASVGLLLNNITQQVNIDYTDFIDCSTGIKFLGSPGTLLATIKRNQFKSSNSPTNSGAGGMSTGPPANGPVSSVAFNSHAFQNAGFEWEVTNAVPSIIVNSKLEDVSYQAGIGIENGYGHIRANIFRNLDIGILNAYNIDENYFGSCNRGILNNTLQEGNAINIQNNLFVDVAKGTELSVVTNISVTENDYYNIPKALASSESYAIRYSNADINPFLIDNNRFYGEAFTNNHLLRNHAIITDANNRDNTISNNQFVGVSHGITMSGTGHLVIDNNFDKVMQGIHLTGEAEITENIFDNIPRAKDDGNLNTLDNTYGVFAVGEVSRNIHFNIFNGTGQASDPGTRSFAIVFEQTGAAEVFCTENTMKGTEVGIQVEGNNNDLGFFCNIFAADDNAHLVAGLQLVPNELGGIITPASLRDQGQGCLDDNQPAGNEWWNATGNNDVVLTPYLGVVPYFKYFAHKFDVNGGTTTQPKHTYGTNWLGLGSDDLTICEVNLQDPSVLGYQKTDESCDDLNTKMLILDASTNSGGNTVVTNPTIAEWLIIKGNLELELNQAENNLIDAQYQPDLVKEIVHLDFQLQKVVVQLYEAYLVNDMESQAILLLENENYVEAKKLLSEHYYKVGNFAESKTAQTDLENLVLNKPDYFYASIDEREADEFNQLYFKQIAEMLIDANEDGREEHQLLYWEKYALTLIKESTLPVAVKAEELLRKNQETVKRHKVEVPLTTSSAINTSFVYNMGIVPNPAMYETNVLINMPSNSTNAKLKLYDSYNTLQVLQEHSLKAGDNVVNIDVSTYSSGLYTFVVEVDNQVVASKHLVVIN